MAGKLVGRRGTLSEINRRGTGTSFNPESLASGTYGQRSGVTAPSGAVSFSAATAWSTIASTINNAASGTKFWFAAGTYRVTSQPTLKSNQEFHFENGAILNGSKLLTGASSGTFDGRNLYYYDGQTQRMPVHPDTTGTNSTGYPLTYRGEDVYLDDVPLRRYDARANVVAGGYFFDLTENRIYIFDNPSGKTVETCQQPYLFTGSGTRTSIVNVVINNARVEKFGSMLQNSPVDSQRSTGWQVLDSTFRLNHGVGLRVSGNNGVIRGCLISTNGQLGVGGSTGDSNGGNDALDLLVEYNEITNNNYARVQPLWEAGASKWANTERLTVRRNWLHDETDVGFWTDINNLDTLYDENLVEDVGWAAFFHEISYAAIIRNNVIRRSGYVRNDDWLHHGGIAVANSKDVQVYGNTISDSQHAIGVVQQDRRYSTGGSGHVPRFGGDIILPSNVLVRNNHVTMNGIGEGQIGAVSDYTPDGTQPWSAGQNVRFRQNQYVVNTTGYRFKWASPAWNYQWAGWQAQGQDVAVTETDSFSGQQVSYAASTRTDP